MSLPPSSTKAEENVSVTLSPGYANYVLGVLFVVYVFNLIDRQVMSVFIGPIKQEFGVSDTAMGLLVGFSFALLYTIAGIPIARAQVTQQRDSSMDILTQRLAILLLSVMILSCSSVPPKNDTVKSGYTETGIASFYGDKHQLKKTASGELYNHDLKTAAHKTQPLGTKIRVTNLSNHKSVVVKINDRGPFVKGRIVDLSKSAFSTIGNTDSGLIDVRIEILE